MAIAKWNVLFFIAIAGIIIWLITLTSNQKMAKYNNQESMEGPDHSEFYSSFLQKLYRNHQPSSSPENELIKSFDLVNNKPSALQIIEYLNWANRSSCKLIHDFGGVIFSNPRGLDGQKAVCLDPKVAPLPANGCLIYSVGINNEWSFDDIMEQYGCKVFAFDPSMDAPDHNRSAMIKFYSMGVGDVDKEETRDNKKWKLKTIQNIYILQGARPRR